MSQEKIGHFTQLKDLAVNTIQSVYTEYDELRKELEKGVALGAAHRIIDELWGATPEAMKVKTKLYSQFPVRNGIAIMNSELTRVAALRIMGLLLPVTEYLAAATVAIEERVEQLLSELKTADANDTAAMLRYNDFRKEVLRYLCYCDTGYYDVRSIVCSDRIQTWESIICSPQAIEEGDYLFLDDFNDKIRAVHKGRVSMKAMTPSFEGYNGTLRDFVWPHQQMLDYIKLTYLFLCFLETHELK